MQNLQSKRLFYDCRNAKLHFWVRSSRCRSCQSPNCLLIFLTFYTVFSCEHFFADTNVAVCFVMSNTLAVVLTRHIATWRLQKGKKSRSD